MSANDQQDGNNNLASGRVSPLSDASDDDPIVHDQLHHPHMGMGGGLDVSDLSPNLHPDPDDEDIDENAPLEVDYGSDDDVSADDDDDDGGLRDTVELSRRTMNLMDNFRDYVSEMGSPNGGDVEAGEGSKVKAKGGEAPTMQLNAQLDWFGGGGLRDFGARQEDDPYDPVAQEYGTPPKLVRYRYAWLRSKRVRRGMGMIAVAAVVISVAVGASKARKERSLPDWNAELDEILEEEKEAKDRHSHHDENGSIMALPEVPFDQTTYPGANPPMQTKPALSGAESILSDILSRPKAESPPDAPSDAYLAVAERYDPRWFSRPEYNGQSYEAALVFCAGQGMRVPCPLDAVCPDGAGSVPYGGYKDEPLGTWAPVLDAPNGWVRVSSAIGTGGGDEAKACMLYAYTHASAPDWGESGGDEEQTRHVLCCKSEGVGDADDGGDGASPTAAVNDDGSTPVAVASDDAERPDESQELIDPDLAFDEMFNDNRPAVDEGVVAEEYAEAERLHPVWWDRPSGWNGKTYDEAIEFCASKSNEGRVVALCPYTALCPMGPHNIPYGGIIEAPGELWAPVADSYNDWVQVGQGTGTCVTYMNEYLMPPDWGTTGEDAEELTTHVMCCATKGSTVGSHPDLPPAAEAVSSRPSVAVADELVKEYQPVWYDRSSGWVGETYSQAEAFCAALGPTHGLCPLEVYCPFGGRESPYGGGVASADLDEGGYQSWAPISDSNNDWVQVGKDGEGLCLTYTHMYLKEPSWGDSAEDSEGITRYLMCCGQPAAAGGSAEVDASQEEGIAEVDASQEGGIEAIPSPPTDGDENPAEGDENPAPYEYVSRMYHPVWYERSDGWRGNTYDEAWNFCASRKSGDEKMMLCSFEAICPLGPRTEPFGGFKEGFEGGEEKKGISWAAISNDPQWWVSVGSDSPCTFYDEKNDPRPDWWGTDGADMGATHYVMCCDEHEVLSMFGLNSEHQASAPQEADAAAPAPMPVSSGFKPKWYDRSSGWTGQTYQEAEDFCTSFSDDGQPTILCPYDAYCSQEGGAPYGGIRDEQNSWSPIMNRHNYWVQVGNEDSQCMMYTDVYPDSPAWGITGEDNEGLTRHVLCCSLQPPEQPSEPAPGPSQSSPPGSELDQIYSRIGSDIHQPVVYGRYDKWHGQGYSEAFDYCGSEHSKLPCSFDALCPSGVGDSGMGIGDMDPVWLPVMDGGGWVELLKDGYCARHSELSPYVDVTRYVICCHEMVGEVLEPLPQPATPPSPLSAAADFLSGAKETDAAPASVAYEEAEEKYHVVGYDRSNGWLGQTYGDALEFCATQNSKVPCPYAAVCPMGSNGPPVGGVEEGTNGVWIPIMDTQNGWVEIGHKDTCMKYSDMKPHPPMWGLTGDDNEEITRHVKCCDEVEGDVPVSGELREVTKLSATEGMILDTMHPVWFDRRDGYHGTTHEEAELFCRSVGNMHLCPIEAYCPNGPGNDKVLFLQKDAFDGEMWAPISSYSNEDTGVGNDWVMVGTKDGDPKSTCSQYEALNDGKSPPWTADGSRTELKQHVLCCMQQEGLKKEQDISRGMNPIWMDDTHGWNGGSYSDAVEFCRGVGGKRLCPYAAYCPHGPGMNPMGGHRVDFNLQGTQWAPVFGKDNDWVLIGRKYGNSATTCYTHNQIEGASPAWGLSDDNSSAKRNIQCCSF